jgi:hypothetical protein
MDRRLTRTGVPPSAYRGGAPAILLKGPFECPYAATA